MLVGSPGIGNLAKRVPPRPVAQVGRAREKPDTFAFTSLMSMPRLPSARPSDSYSSVRAAMCRALWSAICSGKKGLSAKGSSKI